MAPTCHRIFLLSPANAAGVRARLVLNESAAFELAVRLRGGGAPIGEVFRFISGLYFRGKLAYAEAFAAPPEGLPGAVVIVPGAGLVPPETLVTVEQLRSIADVPVDEGNKEYSEPLITAARLLDHHSTPDCCYVLLGSIASGKYTGPLLEVFGERLVFPVDFVGRGDMSRGGLMLRCAHSRTELKYVPIRGAVRHGSRPPRLEKWRKQ